MYKKYNLYNILVKVVISLESLNVARAGSVAWKNDIIINDVLG